jgi:hypothetical protein
MFLAEAKNMLPWALRAFGPDAMKAYGSPPSRIRLLGFYRLS